MLCILEFLGFHHPLEQGSLPLAQVTLPLVPLHDCFVQTSSTIFILTLAMFHVVAGLKRSLTTICFTPKSLVFKGNACLPMHPPPSTRPLLFHPSQACYCSTFSILFHFSHRLLVQRGVLPQQPSPTSPVGQGNCTDHRIEHLLPQPIGYHMKV
ncbi:unnamed protein product [Victoria cruziana]